MSAEQSETKKRTGTKVKLSKPNPKQKHALHRIEISPSIVKVLRVDAKGKIIGSGIARLDGDPIWADKTWIDRLSQKIRDAARNAKIPKGSNIACSVVANGPQVIVQRFAWPEISHQAMIENAKFEIASYLPGAASGFVISAEVQKRNEAVEDKMPTMDVFVAAMPNDMAVAISTAVTWAGFRVINLDVSENVRARLIKHCCVAGGSVPSSYGVLDLSSSLPNVTLYLDGFFYSTQYFSAMQQSSYHAPNTIDELDSSGNSLASVGEHNVEAILREISFVADFIKYQERANIEAILVIGKTQPEFTERLATGLDIPVFATEAWLRTGIAGTVKDDPGSYLDTYASGLPSAVIGSQHMLNLKTPPLLKNPKARMTAITASLLGVILLMLAIGMLVPFIRERSMQSKYRALDVEENRVRAFVLASPTVEMVETLRLDIDFIETRVDGIDDFYEEFAQAAVIVPVLLEAGFSSINEITAYEDKILVRAWAAYYSHVADLLEHFREHDLFRSSGVSGRVIEHGTTEWIDGTAEFTAEMIMERRAGAIINE
ncbi:MAG: hypothetical protein FWE27_01395 [Defluviitaleaceae bacterium]|nr:hypothetical protein [Defluviitaleaceae bacterium]